MEDRAIERLVDATDYLALFVLGSVIQTHDIHAIQASLHILQVAVLQRGFQLLHIIQVLLGAFVVHKCVVCTDKHLKIPVVFLIFHRVDP